MNRRPPRSTRTDTLFPYPTLFRSPLAGDGQIRFALIGGLVQYPLPLGDDGGDQHLPRDIDGGAPHVEDRVYGEQQARALQRQAERGKLDRKSTRLNSSH